MEQSESQAMNAEGYQGNGQVLLEVRELRKYFERGTGEVVQAVDGISFEIKRGTTLGLVGESGSGKSTAARAILRLIEPTSGQVIYDGTDLRKLRSWELQRMRRRMQMIFQDPLASLNPVMCVGDIIEDGMRIHSLYERRRRRDRVAELLDLVGVGQRFAPAFPHEFSGGQQQRIGIARALAVEPDFLVCDEPVASLDVSIQAQILGLLQELQAQFDLTYLFIAHNLAVIDQLSDRVAVMYLGQLMEIGSTEEVFDNALHPYTQSLLSAVPRIYPSADQRIRLEGEVPSPINPPPGCRFHTRCPVAEAQCRQITPELRPIPGHDHLVACHKTT